MSKYCQKLVKSCPRNGMEIEWPQWFKSINACARASIRKTSKVQRLAQGCLQNFRACKQIPKLFSISFKLNIFFKGCLKNFRVYKHIPKLLSASSKIHYFSIKIDLELLQSLPKLGARGQWKWYRPFTYPKSSQNVQTCPQVDQKCSQSSPKWSKNGPKTVPKQSQNASK